VTPDGGVSVGAGMGNAHALDARVRFLTEFARRLHNAGVSSQRLEGAIRATARALRLPSGSPSSSFEVFEVTSTTPGCATWEAE